MGARAEGQARVQPHDGGIGSLCGFRQLMVPRHDPGALAELHRLELVQPGAFPVFVLDGAEAGLGPFQARVERLQRGQQGQRIGIGREQRGQGQLVPQRGFAHARLQDCALVAGVCVGIEHGHRQCADVIKGVLVAGLGGFSAAQGQFEEGHGGVRQRRDRARILDEAGTNCAFSWPIHPARPRVLIEFRTYYRVTGCRFPCCRCWPENPGIYWCCLRQC